MHVLGPVLATGCTAVIKPSEEASLAILRTAQLLVEAVVPPGVVNVVTGYGVEAGAALAGHPDVKRIAFTGSTETGREIIKASSGNMKRLQLELGGKSPDLVFADADLDKAVPGVAMGVFSKSALKEQYTEFIFKIGNDLRDSGSSDVQLFRAPAKIIFLRSRQEIP